MGVISRLGDNIKRGIRNWLQIQPSSPYGIQINEVLDYELNAIRNRIWYRGDSSEIEQWYQQAADYADRYKFWAARSTPGLEMRKIHTGLPGLIVRILSGIVLSDMNDFEFESAAHEQLWTEIGKENKFMEIMDRCVKELLYIGDGAFKVTVNTDISRYPILEWFSGEFVEIVQEYGRLKEVVFKKALKHDRQQYTLYEHYGYGRITYELYKGDDPVELSAIDATKNLKDTAFDGSVILAIPLKVYASTKWDGRGGSIYDGKLDSFDAFDEVWSQWMDALRKGRATRYVPEDLIPRDRNSGMLMTPNPFDNSFIKIRPGGMKEDGGNGSGIEVQQPAIPHDSYLASYVTALDLCLQGIISPSTLGIDVKKLDNAEAQREKEKATLYTRNAIVEALQEGLPDVVAACINAYQILAKMPAEEVTVNIPFGEYANPSFESQVETVGKARAQGIMSIERSVEELYGDSLDAHCKQEEIARLKAEQGIAEVSDPGLNLEGMNTDNE